MLPHEVENRYFIKNQHDFTAAAELVEMRTDHPNTAAPADPAQQCPRYPFLTLPPGTNINPNPKARPFPAAVSQPGTDTHTHTHTPHHSGFSPSGEGLTCPACRGAAGSPFDSCTT